MEIPPEIVLEIVSFVQWRKDLRHIALSCRAFCGPAQSRIFRSVDLFKAHTFNASRFCRIYDALEVNPSLGELVQELAIDPLVIRPDRLASFLQKVTNLRNLHFQASSSLCALPTGILRVIKATISLPSLFRLSFTEFSTIPIALLQGDTYFNELELTSVNLSAYPREIEGSPHSNLPLANLKNLSLIKYGGGVRPETQLSQLLAIVPKGLTRLHLDCRQIYEHGCMELLDAMGQLPSLHHFVYSLTPFGSNNFLHKGSFYPSLKHLEIDLMRWQWTNPDEASKLNLLQDVCGILNHATPLPLLEHVTLDNWVSSEKRSLMYFHHPTLLKDVQDLLLQQDKFPQFKQLDLICQYEARDFTSFQADQMETKLREVVGLMMPILHKQGRVRVAFELFRDPGLGLSS